MTVTWMTSSEPALRKVVGIDDAALMATTKRSAETPSVTHRKRSAAWRIGV